MYSSQKAKHRKPLSFTIITSVSDVKKWITETGQSLQPVRYTAVNPAPFPLQSTHTNTLACTYTNMHAHIPSLSMLRCVCVCARARACVSVENPSNKITTGTSDRQLVLFPVYPDLNRQNARPYTKAKSAFGNCRISGALVKMQDYTFQQNTNNAQLFLKSIQTTHTDSLQS